MSAAAPRGGELEDEHRDAIRIAEDAGRLLLDLRRALDYPSTDAREMRAQGDRRSNELIVARIRELYPEDGLLSEESADDLSRLERSRAWIVDPLDGTREFGEAGRSDWAVHVALAIDGIPAVGAVALPARGLTLASRPAPACPPPPSGGPRVIVSRSRPPAMALAVAEMLGGSLVEMGSAGAKMMAVVLGDADVYLHAGGQYEWDSCAPVAVAQAAGLHTSRIDGSPLRYNEPKPYLPDVLICHPQIAPTVLDAVRRAAEREGVETLR